jgi:hypothetical protein
MLSEINNLIDVKPGDKMNGCFVGITQSMSMNDGSFVIHHFLSHCLKSSTPVCSWYNDVENSSRGQLYGSFKKDFGLENYLVRLKEKTRIWMTKLI